MARRSKEQRERDLQEISSRYLRGEYQVDIAKSLGAVLETMRPGVKRMVYGEAPNAERTERQSCGDWLVEYLETEGPSRTKDVLAAASDEGFSRDMVYRARKELEARIVNTKGHKHPQNRWALAGFEENDDENYEESQESQPLDG